MRTVYYAGYNPVLPPIRYGEPELAIKAMDVEALKAININKCPSFQDYFKNTFAVSWCFDYELEIQSDGGLKSQMYDQMFFDSVVKIRSSEHRVYTLMQFYLFASEEPLDMEVLPTTGLHNGFSDNATLYSGEFNIGNWFRPIECTFMAKPHADKIIIQSGEPYCFVKFRTDEPVKLQRFHPTEEIKELEAQIASLRYLNGSKRHSLLDYYNKLRASGYQKRLMSLIKSNLI